MYTIRIMNYNYYMAHKGGYNKLTSSKQILQHFKQTRLEVEIFLIFFFFLDFCMKVFFLPTKQQ